MIRELIVDNFAGGGGASTGIEMATGRSVDIAINHDENAIAMHETNHPDTLHYCESVFDIDPVDHHALVTSNLIKMRGTNIGQEVTAPLQTVTAGGNHFGEVRAFLLKYYGTNIGHAADEPLQTVTTKHRFGLVTVEGIDYQIVDIGMRMLQPHELYAAQGFPSWYIIDQDYKGKKYAKDKQVARCGNAVPPPFAEALVRANLPEMCVPRREVAA